ncbi:unnamed protein product [Paramecium primaurelia]|uniref:Uncharacterized protein n=1 Tax=Paramecium primaurelia TaxID=5886 RepID=A0A8S1PN10_PARPR|nr:unnamed protein product [Paramecium primaurelia]
MEGLIKILWCLYWQLKQQSQLNILKTRIQNSLEGNFVDYLILYPKTKKDITGKMKKNSNEHHNLIAQTATNRIKHGPENIYQYSQLSINPKFFEIKYIDYQINIYKNIGDKINTFKIFIFLYQIQGVFLILFDLRIRRPVKNKVLQLSKLRHLSNFIFDNLLNEIILKSFYIQIAFLLNESYLQIKCIQLYHTIQRKIAKKLHISQLDIEEKLMVYQLNYMQLIAMALRIKKNYQAFINDLRLHLTSLPSQYRTKRTV